MKKLTTLMLVIPLLPIFTGCEKQVDPLVRGKYLATIGGCGDCHTPKIFGPGGLPMQDSTRIYAGHPAGEPYPTWSPADMQRSAMALTNPLLTAWAGPWGVSFSINLTPDNATGLGEWTEEAFIQAMRTGKHQGQPNGREILPPMPIESLRKMTDSDLKALWSYLRSVPPIQNQVPLPVPPAAPPAPEQ